MFFGLFRGSGVVRPWKNDPLGSCVDLETRMQLKLKVEYLDGQIADAQLEE